MITYKWEISGTGIVYIDGNVTPSYSYAVDLQAQQYAQTLLDDRKAYKDAFEMFVQKYLPDKTYQDYYSGHCSDQFELIWDFNGGTATTEYTAAGYVNVGEEIMYPEIEKTGYNFSAWTYECTCASGVISAMPACDLTITAVYEKKEYTVNFYNNSETPYSSCTVPYMEMPTCSGGTPTRPSTSEYDFIFTGWDKEIAYVTGDTNYYAMYDLVDRVCKVRFIASANTSNSEGRQIVSAITKQETEYLYDSLIRYTETDPAIYYDYSAHTNSYQEEETEFLIYKNTFSAWTPEYKEKELYVSGNTDFFATYDKTPITRQLYINVIQHDINPCDPDSETQKSPTLLSSFTYSATTNILYGTAASGMSAVTITNFIYSGMSYDTAFTQVLGPTETASTTDIMMNDNINIYAHYNRAYCYVDFILPNSADCDCYMLVDESNVVSAKTLCVKLNTKLSDSSDIYVYNTDPDVDPLGYERSYKFFDKWMVGSSSQEYKYDEYVFTGNTRICGTTLDWHGYTLSASSTITLYRSEDDYTPFNDTYLTRDEITVPTYATIAGGDIYDSATLYINSQTAWTGNPGDTIPANTLTGAGVLQLHFSTCTGDTTENMNINLEFLDNTVTTGICSLTFPIVVNNIVVNNVNLLRRRLVTINLDKTFNAIRSNNSTSGYGGYYIQQAPLSGIATYSNTTKISPYVIRNKLYKVSFRGRSWWVESPVKLGEFLDSTGTLLRPKVSISGRVNDIRIIPDGYMLCGYATIEYNIRTTIDNIELNDLKEYLAERGITTSIYWKYVDIVYRSLTLSYQDLLTATATNKYIQLSPVSVSFYGTGARETLGDNSTGTTTSEDNGTGTAVSLGSGGGVFYNCVTGRSSTTELTVNQYCKDIFVLPII